MAVDHSDDSQVVELFERIRREQKGRLDVLVNNVYAGISAITSAASSNRKYWELGPEETASTQWDAVMRVGLRNHYICSVLASRLMLEYRHELDEKSKNNANVKKSSSTQRPGLIFNISSYGGLQYLFTVPYGVGASHLIFNYSIFRPTYSTFSV